MTPTPAQIKQARTRAGLTQTQAAELLPVTLRNWQHWEGGRHAMSAALWELFRLKAKAAPGARP
ncbi:MAG: helix-turn-helix domain-containing protein [Proteobacteria bacterium]|nr:helix-turn-helix domain-containing protein [Pseudomonadota bacterium]